MLPVGSHILVDLDDKLAGRRDTRVRIPRLEEAASMVRMGSVKAAVFPVPVWAMPMRSRPPRIRGIAVD